MGLAARSGCQIRHNLGVVESQRDSSLNLAMPILAHEDAGVDCCGCIVVRVRGNDAELCWVTNAGPQWAS